MQESIGEIALDRQLERDGAATRVTVTHTAFSTEAARDGHSHGWPALLDALRSHAETEAVTSRNR